MMQKPYGALGYKLRRIITIGYGNSNPMEIFIEKIGIRRKEKQSST